MALLTKYSGTSNCDVQFNSTQALPAATVTPVTFAGMVKAAVVAVTLAEATPSPKMFTPLIR
ncbi:hypothetical protein D3C85_922010 [compost metagenome]